MEQTISSEFAVEYGTKSGFRCEEHDDIYILEKYTTRKIVITIPKGGLGAWLWKKIRKLMDDS